MLSYAFSYTILGLEAFLVSIEIDIHSGLPLTNIVGLPDNVIKESKERIRSAIKNSGYKYPPQRVTINLSPAHLKKEGSSFELAIALGILSASGQIPSDSLNEFALLGELSLDGTIKPVKGGLPVALGLDRQKFKGLILPQENAGEAALCTETKIFPVHTLIDVVGLLNDPNSIKPWKNEPLITMPASAKNPFDFCEVKGQSHAKRGLEIAAAGNHNVLMIGPPGCGKSMLAKRFPTILPEMNQKEAFETTKIYSVMGLLKIGEACMINRPFRTVHHTTSAVALVGGGTIPRPGEISLCHNGVLFLDELPEFSRHVLETLRQPLEDQHITIARVNQTLQFPAKFILISAMNPCMCGHLGSSRIPCRCSSTQIQKYRSRISGPLLDRIDLHIDVPAVNHSELNNPATSEKSEQIKERVLKARTIQAQRLPDEQNSVFNGQMNHRQIRQFCVLEKEETELLRQAMIQLNLSARAYDKILKISRTIADLDGSERIKLEHLAEAIQYRSLDRNFLS
ncbi:MAG: YifB family Mg chelatase-like AAA ATPase [Candidatus Omnitrophota bacterium]